MNVPLLDLKPQTELFREEIIQAITNVVDSTRYILGSEVENLEEEIANYCGARYGVGVSSGTDALLVSLMALEIGAGDLVLTTPYTFFATMGSIIRVGALPIFVDIDPDTMNIDPMLAAEILEKDKREGKRIKAILPVHLFGQCADMQKIMHLARQYEIAVIEDAAQGIGADCPFLLEEEVSWRRAGSIGDVGCFSFFPSKNLGCVGDGGMVTTNDQHLYERLKILRNHGAEPKYYHSFIGGNFRLDTIQAAVLRIKLPYLERWHQQRRDNNEEYRKLFAEMGLINNPVILPAAVYKVQDKTEDHNYHIYNQFVIRVPRREELRKYLQDNNIGCEVYYPLCLHQQKCLEPYTVDRLSFPVSEKAAEETLALPVYPELTGKQQQYVVETISRFFQAN
jgi:dTDP-4-amino-4,6-dideoxygalactose transaminase